MRISWRRTVATLVAGLTLGTAATVATATPASAAGCYANSCTWQDPQAMGCSSDAQTLEEFTVGVLRVLLRYSPACGAAWTKWMKQPNSPLGTYPECSWEVAIQGGSSSSGPATLTQTVCVPVYTTTYTEGWTTMISFNMWVRSAEHWISNSSWNYTRWR